MGYSDLRSWIPSDATGQMFIVDPRGPYSDIPKLSIWVAACSANLKTLPE